MSCNLTLPPLLTLLLSHSSTSKLSHIPKEKEEERERNGSMFAGDARAPSLSLSPLRMYTYIHLRGAIVLTVQPLREVKIYIYIYICFPESLYTLQTRVHITQARKKSSESPFSACVYPNADLYYFYLRRNSKIFPFFFL